MGFFRTRTFFCKVLPEKKWHALFRIFRYPKNLPLQDLEKDDGMLARSARFLQIAWQVVLKNVCHLEASGSWDVPVALWRFEFP